MYTFISKIILHIGFMILICLLLNTFIRFMIIKSSSVKVSYFYKLIPLVLMTHFLILHHLGFTIQAILYSLFFYTLIALSFIDTAIFEVPHRGVLFIFVLGLINLLLNPEIHLSSRLLGFFAASVPLLLLALLSGGGMGGGDIKLVAACGFFLGPVAILLGVFLGTLFAACHGIIYLLKKDKTSKDQLAFVPYLSLGMILSSLYGSSILSWYFSLFNI